MKKSKQTETTSNFPNKHSKFAIENSEWFPNNMASKEITPSNETTNNKLLKKNLKSPKEMKYHSDLSESSGCEVKRKKKKSKNISSEINMDIDKASSSIAHNAGNEPNNSEESNSELKLKTASKSKKKTIVSQDMFEGSSNEIDINNCSTSSTEKFFPLNQEAEKIYIKKRKKKLENDSPKKKSKKHKTIENSILETDMDENAMFSSNEAMIKEEKSKKKEKHHGDIKNKRKSQDSEMKESIANNQTKNEMDTPCYDINIKTESPKKKHKKHKTLDSETDNENGTTKITVREKDLCSEVRNDSLSDFETIRVKKKKSKIDNENGSTKTEVVVKDSCGGDRNNKTSSLSDLETIHVKKKRKLHAKELAREKEKCQNDSACSIVDGLLKKLDAINSSREKNSPIKKDTIHKSSKDEIEEFLYAGKGKKDNSVIDESTAKSSISLKTNSVMELDKTTNVPSIPDSVLDNLLLKCDEIVQEDKDKCSQFEKLEKEFIKEMFNNERKRHQETAFGSDKKKEVIELIKDTTMSVEELKEKLDITTDYDMVDQLKCIDIELPCSLPLVHKIARQVGNAPSPEQRQALEDAGIKLKLGKFTKEEDEKIKNNWLLFCKLHRWDKDSPELFLKGSTKSTHGVLPFKTFKKFCQFISHNFEDRIMHNIYLRFQRLYSEKVNSFTPEDDAIIMEYKNNSNTTQPFADIAVLLKRSRLSVLKRYKQLEMLKKFDSGKIEWNKYLIKQLLVNLLTVTGSKRVSDLKERRITAEEWEKIAIAMDIPVIKLTRVWQKDLYTRCLNPNYEDECRDVRNELIDLLYKKKYNDWREVDWNELAEKFHSYNGQRLYKMFHDIIRSKVPKDDHKDLRACVECLKENPPTTKRKNKFCFVSEILKELEEHED